MKRRNAHFFNFQQHIWGRSSVTGILTNRLVLVDGMDACGGSRLTTPFILKFGNR
jgi:hypothetical protein